MEPCGAGRDEGSGRSMGVVNCKGGLFFRGVGIHVDGGRGSYL